jgi:hypothetical protein
MPNLHIKWTIFHASKGHPTWYNLVEAVEPYLVEGNINLVDLSSCLTIGVHKIDYITYLLSIILHVLHIKTWSRMHAYMGTMYLFMVYNYTNVGAMGSQSNGGLGCQKFQNVSIVLRRMAFVCNTLLLWAFKFFGKWQ